MNRVHWQVLIVTTNFLILWGIKKTRKLKNLYVIYFEQTGPKTCFIVAFDTFEKQTETTN